MHKPLRAFLLAAAVAVPAVGCGATVNHVSDSDRAAFDQFAAAVRQWRTEGTEPWSKALSQGNDRLQAVGPTAEANMKQAIAKMDVAVAKIDNPSVKASLQRLVATYRSKLADVHQVDNAGYSLKTLKQGLADLKTDGVATQKAWNAYVEQAKKAWDSNPLAGLNVG